MFNSISRIVSVALVAGFVSFGVAAQERGTKEEAQAMVQAAVAHIKKAGAEKAFGDFMNDKATWFKKDLYVFVIDFKGVVVAHGATPKLVGKDLSGLRNDSGTSTVLGMGELAKTKGSGWYDYKFTNPTTKKTESKSSYVMKTPGAESYVGVGVYQ